ncbi:MAG: FxsA family protein [Candidatus Omnitrophica bacterium]|nr:FxsA family protein [Candidatus Omnitrophota bacterium]
MLFIFFLIILPILEIIILVKVSAMIGALNVIFILILTAILGSFLARLQGFFVFQKIQQTLNEGAMPSAELLDGVLIWLGGILLVVPGFITDVFGLILLLPPTRFIVNFFLKRKLNKMMQQGQTVHWGPSLREDTHYDDIDIS